MLSELSIQNYALIDDLQVRFPEGLITITGETGAGKSILLGALSLALGKRADLSALRDPAVKCIVEAQFRIGAYGLEPFFSENDLNYEEPTFIRREIHPNGRSRAFVNDSPVTLDILSKLGKRLIDIHSQHQTLQLADIGFQCRILDALAGNSELLQKYQNTLSSYNIASLEYQELIEKRQEALKAHDYNNFLLNELLEADLKSGIQDKLEDQYETLNNAEEILEKMADAYQMIHSEGSGLLDALGELRRLSSKLSGYSGRYENLHERIESVYLELSDIGAEFEDLRDTVSADPRKLEEVSAALEKLYALHKKHGTNTTDELIGIRDDLDTMVRQTEDLDSIIETIGLRMEKLENQLESYVSGLRTNRENAGPELCNDLESRLKKLGIPNATFKISIKQLENFGQHGKDEVRILFSANKGSQPGELKKVASGGELSRIMLSIKAILVEYEPLPTLMFDEIDSGVSGEISNQMGDVMRKMSRKMQVFTITHDPQIASKGTLHYKVFKEDADDRTHTRIKELSLDERIVELAEMLGGKSLTDSALAHARELLN